MDSTMVLIITQVIITATLFGILLYEYLSRKIEPLAWILSIVFFAFLRSIFDLIIELSGKTDQPIAQLEFLITGISFLLLYIYLELTLYNRPYFSRFTVMMMIFGIFLGLLFYYILGGNLAYPDYWPLPVTSNSPLLFELPFDIFAISVWGLALTNFYKMYTHAIAGGVKQISLMLAFAALIFLVVQIIELSEFFFAYTNPPQATVVALPGFLIIVLVYIKQPDFSYSSPVRLYRLMLFHKSGLDILSLTIDQKYRKSQHDPTLVGGIASALNTAYMEITQQQSGSIKKLTMDKVTFIFTRSDDIFAILEIERSTHILRTALRRFTESFSEQFRTQIEQAGKGIFEFEGFEKLFYRYFPFAVDVQEIKNTQNP